MLFSVMLAQTGCPGAVGGSMSPPTLALSLSTLRPPLAVVEVAGSVALPAGTAAVSVLLAQVSQLAVAGTETALATTVPLTVMFIGRSPVVPLAYRRTMVAVPALAALTVHST